MAVQVVAVQVVAVQVVVVQVAAVAAALPKPKSGLPLLSIA